MIIQWVEVRRGKQTLPSAGVQQEEEAHRNTRLMTWEHETQISLNILHFSHFLSSLVMNSLHVFVDFHCMRQRPPPPHPTPVWFGSVSLCPGDSGLHR